MADSTAVEDVENLHHLRLRKKNTEYLRLLQVGKIDEEEMVRKKDLKA